MIVAKKPSLLDGGYDQPQTYNTLPMVQPAPLPIDQGIYAPPQVQPIPTAGAPAPLPTPTATAPTQSTQPADSQALPSRFPKIPTPTPVADTPAKEPAAQPTAQSPLPSTQPAVQPPPASDTPQSNPDTHNTLPSAPPPAGPLAPPAAAVPDPVVNAPPPSNPAAPPTQIGESSPPVVGPPPANNPASGATAPPPGASAPPPASTPAATPAAQNNADQETAEERMRRILALNEETKPVDVPSVTFGADNNLIAQQISPADSSRLQQREGLTDAELARIATIDRNAAAASHAGEAIDPTVGDRLAKLRGLQDTTLDKAVNGPDRYKMALDQFNQFTKDTEPDYDLGRKKALNDAAAFGYTGSGRLVTDYGNLDLTRERDLDSQKARLLNTALEGTIGDRNNLLNTLSQYGNDEASYEAQTRAEQRAERQYRVDQGDKDVAAEYAKGDYLNTAENNQRAVEEGQRDEQRGERSYQRDLAEQALADQMNGARLQDQLNQSEFERDQTRLNDGYANDPSSAYENAAQQAFQQGQISAEELAQIMQFIAQQRQAA